jgi:hypothetical protein
MRLTGGVRKFLEKWGRNLDPGERAEMLADLDVAVTRTATFKRMADTVRGFSSFERDSNFRGCFWDLVHCPGCEEANWIFLGAGCYGNPSGEREVWGCRCHACGATITAHDLTEYAGKTYSHVLPEGLPAPLGFRKTQYDEDENEEEDDEDES